MLSKYRCLFFQFPLFLRNTDSPNGYSNNKISNSDNVAFGENAQVKVQNSVNDEIIAEFKNILNGLTLNEKADLIKAMYQFKKEEQEDFYMKTCINCGEENVDTLDKCWKCGHTLPVEGIKRICV